MTTHSPVAPKSADPAEAHRSAGRAVGSGRPIGHPPFQVFPRLRARAPVSYYEKIKRT